MQNDAMLLPAGVWRRVFRVLWILLALNSLWTFVLVSVAIVFGGSLYARIWRYRHHSTPLQQQTKWLVYGWDIDILIRCTLTYGILTALLVGIYFCSIVAWQRLFAFARGGEQSEIVTVVSTLAIAALFIPLRNKIQELIDRRFYRKKYDAQLVLQQFSETVRDETDLEQLTARLMQVVDETMQPKSVSVWVKK